MKNYLSFLLTVVMATSFAEAGLEYSYYQSRCLEVESLVRREVLSIMLADATAPPSFLRLMFHDCQVQGCDGSILLDPQDSAVKTEMVSAKNFGIRMREMIGRIKTTLEAECPGQVSCADIIAMAARDSVALSGGPEIQIPLGRKDSITSSYQKAEASLPSSRISVDGMLKLFAAMGMNVEESVAILGAHTLGVGHCISIVDRLYDPQPDDQIDSTFEAQLRLSCPEPVPRSNLTFVPNDLTPLTFDNQYFRHVSMGKGLFAVDSGISRDPRTISTVQQFSLDENYFFQVFSSAFVKLSLTNILSGGEGEVRRECNKVNA